MKTWDFLYWTKVQYTALPLFARRTSDEQGRVSSDEGGFQNFGFQVSGTEERVWRSVISERCE